MTSHDHRFTLAIQTLRHYITNYGKLPFVEYSVVKDQTGGISPLAKLAARERFPPNPLGSLTRGAPKPHAVRSPFKTIRRGGISPLAKLAARERFPPNPLGSLTRGAPKPHAVRSPFKDQPGHPLPAEARGASDLVENTGLEPVTSWLQTRRSPS